MDEIFKNGIFGILQMNFVMKYTIKELQGIRQEKLLGLLTSQFPSYLEDFLRFHKISQEEFYEVANKFVNKNIFQKR